MNKKYFEQEQTVYHYEYGKGIVVDIRKDNDFPVLCRFDNELCSFTFDGRYTPQRKITLSQEPLPEITNKPVLQFEKGDLVLVKNEGCDCWIIAFFIREVILSGKKYHACSFDPEGRYARTWDFCKKYDK